MTDTEEEMDLKASPREEEKEYTEGGETVVYEEVSAEEMRLDLLEMIDEEIERESKVYAELQKSQERLQSTFKRMESDIMPRQVSRRRTTVAPTLAGFRLGKSAAAKAAEAGKEPSAKVKNSKHFAEIRLLHQWEGFFNELDVDHKQKVLWGDILDAIAEYAIEKAMPDYFGQLAKSKTRAEVAGLVNAMIVRLEVDRSQRISFAEFIRTMKDKNVKQVRFRGSGQTIGLVDQPRGMKVRSEPPNFYYRENYQRLKKVLPNGVYPLISHRKRVIGLVGAETWFTMLGGVVNFIKFRHEMLVESRLPIVARQVISEWLEREELRSYTNPSPVYLGDSALLVKYNVQLMNKFVFRQWQLQCADGSAVGAKSLYPVTRIPMWRQRQKFRSAAQQVRLAYRPYEIATAVLSGWLERQLAQPASADLTFEALTLSTNYDHDTKMQRVKVLQLNLPAGLTPKLDKEGDLIGFAGTAPRRDLLKAIVLFKESCSIIKALVNIENRWGGLSSHVVRRDKLEQQRPTTLYTANVLPEEKSFKRREELFASVLAWKNEKEQDEVDAERKEIEMLRDMTRVEPDLGLKPYEEWFSGEPEVHEEEDRFLQETTMLNRFFQKTRGLHWTNRINWNKKSKPLNTWAGLDTDENGLVVRLALPRNHLTGSLPRAICNLRRIQILDLRNNRELKGMLPEELSLMRNLRVLALDNCHKLTGDIPPGVADLKFLEVLSLKNCEGIEGPLPPDLDQMQSLQELNLHGLFRLDGPIPQSLGQLPELKFVSFAHCSGLTGTIPPELGQSRRLNIVNFQGCSGLTGTVPEALAYKGIVHEHIEYLNFKQCPGLVEVNPASFVRSHAVHTLLNPRDRIFNELATGDEFAVDVAEDEVVEDTDSEFDPEEMVEEPELEDFRVYDPDESTKDHVYYSSAQAFKQLTPDQQAAYLDALTPAQHKSFIAFLVSSGALKSKAPTTRGTVLH